MKFSIFVLYFIGFLIGIFATELFLIVNNVVINIGDTKQVAWCLGLILWFCGLMIWIVEVEIRYK